MKSLAGLSSSARANVNKLESQLSDWKENIAVADLVYAFSDRRDTKTVGVITKLKSGGCPSDDSAVVKWLSNDPPMGKYQYLYNLYPIELEKK